MFLAGLIVAGLSALLVHRGAVSGATGRRVVTARVVAVLGTTPLLATLAWHLRPPEGSDGIGLVVPALTVVGLTWASVLALAGWLVSRGRDDVASKQSLATFLTVVAATPLLLFLPFHLSSVDAPDQPVWEVLRLLGLFGAAAAVVAVVALRRPALCAPACFLALTAYPSAMHPLFLLGPVLVAGAPMLLLATMLHLGPDQHRPRKPPPRSVEGASR